MKYSDKIKSTPVKRSPISLWGGLIVLFLGTTVMFFASAANGPDQNLEFTREITSELTPDRVDRNISTLTRWPQWFHSLADAKSVSSQNTTEVKENQLLKLTVDPKKGKKKFELTAKVTEFIPGKKLKLSVLDDSTGRLTRIFDQLEWSIEILPDPKGSKIRGTAKAHTCHWRSRLFGKLAEKIVMYQVFYPNIVKLASLRQPFSADPPQQPSGFP